jgi:hypothetical protein
VIYYGYENTRHGEVYLTDGTFLNIRSFYLPYADYRGPFKDNPFTLEAKQEPPEPEIPEAPIAEVIPEPVAAEVIPEPVTAEVVSEPAAPETKHESLPDPAKKYTPETVDAFTEIAKTGGGDIIFSSGPDDTIEKIRMALQAEKGKNLDLVICFDTTQSMRKYFNSVRSKLIPTLNEMLIDFPSFRIGMVLYRDYRDSYLTKSFPFTDDFNKFQRDLNDVRVGGGGDIPEAVYEALYEGATGFSWERESKVMILIGDAPPHPKPRGAVTKEMVDSIVNEKKIKVHAMVMPQ